MESRPSCPPPIPLKQSQQHISTRSKYTPLKRGVSNTSSGSLSKSDAERLPSDVAGLAVKVSCTNEDGAKVEKSKSKVSFSSGMSPCCTADPVLFVQAMYDGRQRLHSA